MTKGSFVAVDQDNKPLGTFRYDTTTGWRFTDDKLAKLVLPFINGWLVTGLPDSGIAEALKQGWSNGYLTIREASS
jgi:hypothetical protein